MWQAREPERSLRLYLPLVPLPSGDWLCRVHVRTGVLEWVIE